MNKPYLFILAAMLCCVMPACTKKESLQERLTRQFIGEVKKAKPDMEKIKTMAVNPAIYPAQILVQEDKLDLLKQLYTAGSVQLDTVDTNGESVFFTAIRTLNSEAVQWLLENGANPVQMNNNRAKPLTIAESMQQSSLDETKKQELNKIINLVKNQVTRELNGFESKFKAAVDQRKPDLDEISDIISKARTRYWDEWSLYPARYLLQKKKYYIMGNLKTLMLLYTADQNNETLLFWAVRNYNSDAVSWLLDNDVDREVINLDWKKACQVAEELDKTANSLHKDDTQVIVQLFRDKDTEDYLKKKVFELINTGGACSSAELKNYMERMEVAGLTFPQHGTFILPDYDQDIDSAILQRATENDCIDLIKFMLTRESPLSYDYPIPYGTTREYLINIYVGRGDLEMVKMLIEGNYDYSSDIDYALYIAVQNNYTDLVDYLIAHGANANYWPPDNTLEEIQHEYDVSGTFPPSVTVRENTTLLYYAIMNGNSEIADRLLQNGADPYIEVVEYEITFVQASEYFSVDSGSNTYTEISRTTLLDLARQNGMEEFTSQIGNPDTGSPGE